MRGDGEIGILQFACSCVRRAANDGAAKCFRMLPSFIGPPSVCGGGRGKPAAMRVLRHFFAESHPFLMIRRATLRASSTAPSDSAAKASDV